MSALVFLFRHRRVVAVHLWICGLGALAWPLSRFAGSSADLAGALQEAQRQVDEMRPVIGEEFDLAAAFVEPRYLAAEDLPFDLAVLSVGLALVCLLAGALLCGGDWRSRAVHITWSSPAHRGGPAVAMVVAWTAWCTVLVTLLLVAASAALLVTAHIRGLPDGIGLGAVGLVLVRGVLVVACASGVGAAAGVAVRSEVAVILGVLAYVIVGELVAPALMAASGFRSGATRVVELVVAESRTSRSDSLECLAPRCPDVIVPGGGTLVASGGLVLIIAFACAIAYVAARRPVWR